MKGAIIERGALARIMTVKSEGSALEKHRNDRANF